MFEIARVEHEATERGDATRDHLLGVALRLFRRRGLDGTTMRAIAGAANVSLGAAYYYVPSKDALVHAYYDHVQDEHAARVRAACATTTKLPERVRAALLMKLDILREDRALLGALFRYAGDRGHPLSVFSEATRGQRDHAVATFALALEGAGLSASLRPIAARALWLAHLGLLLYFIHDGSEGQTRTRRLAERIAELYCTGLQLASLPGASRALKPVLEALTEARLIASPTKTPEVSA